MSRDAGVHFLDRHLNEYLAFSRQGREDFEDSSVFGFMFERFQNIGASLWPMKTVEYFLVYLLTEIVVTPHTLRQGHNSMTLVAAYERIVERLVCQNLHSGNQPYSFHLLI